MKLSVFDAYINVIGGLRLDEPGADLPVALAVASSYPVSYTHLTLPTILTV